MFIDQGGKELVPAHGWRSREQTRRILERGRWILCCERKTTKAYRKAAYKNVCRIASSIVTRECYRRFSGLLTDLTGAARQAETAYLAAPVKCVWACPLAP